MSSCRQGEKLMTYGGERAAPRPDGAPADAEGNERILGDLSCFDLDAELWYSPKVTCEGEAGTAAAAAASTMSQRAGYTCAPLEDGRVLIFGGVDGEVGERRLHKQSTLFLSFSHELNLVFCLSSLSRAIELCLSAQALNIFCAAHGHSLHVATGQVPE